MIFNDFDEYLFIPDIKLIDYIKLNPTFTSFGFKNILWNPMAHIWAINI